MSVIRVSDVHVHRSPVTGALILSAMVNGYRMERTFFGYSRRTAIALFREEAARG